MLATPWLPETFFLGRIVGAGKREKAGWNEQNCRPQTQAGSLLLIRACQQGARGQESFCWLGFLTCKADY